MDAESIVESWKRRLLEMANNLPYVFRDTPEESIREHRRWVTFFDGYSDREIDNAQAELGVTFPEVFRAFLLGLARRHGELFAGSDLAEIDEFEEYRLLTLKMLAATNRRLVLPREAVVFLVHERYSFVYLMGTGGIDGPVMEWLEGHDEPRQISPTFARMVDDEISLMERVDADWRGSGGYYVTLSPDGRIKSMCSDERLLMRHNGGASNNQL